MGRLSIGEETSVPATPTEGNTVYSTVATPSLLRLKDDAGNVYTFALLEKAQTITAQKTMGASAPLVYTGSSLTISGGAITITGSFHTIDTEGGAASDDLDNINGGVDGQILYILITSGARDVVIRHNAGGTGNILTATASNITMGTTNSVIQFMLVGAFWREVERQ